ncbi:hypothetical protein GCM10007424_18010 [Flavobacterium suaedae]|uniref:HTH cro/C1-type domain-containing protein n=1 Tax=Flavobacterium suaedae TaxID=1767027 RepID=A0ABQ1JZ93_9FLAO|nr:helix-turn-helix transcriptional regulator [Flavobacterium suaedae]GGB78300.1 hypothetical protein GCM10007424_18010 [Flavobacterium suaedae]
MVFGKNLKKIRSVHGMSQQEFAELFDLKRATLGAYEEDRSNPKLETIIKIANHFSIGLEQLVTKELTVNQLLRFNDALTTNPANDTSQKLEGIPYITEDKKEVFIKDFNNTNNISKVDLNNIYLPNVTGKDKLAFVVSDLTMSGGAAGFLPKDIVIGKQTPLTDIERINGQLAIITTKDDLYFRKVSYQNSKVVLNANHPGVEPITVNSKDIKGVWSVVHIFRYTVPASENATEQRLAQLENAIAALRQKTS